MDIINNRNIIKLTISEKSDWNKGEPTYINPRQITTIDQDRRNTTIGLVSGKFREVSETPAEIMQIIKDSGLVDVLYQVGMTGLS